jgi:methionyl-tRNA synthetase
MSNVYRLLIIYLKPVLPELAKNSEAFLNEINPNWESIKLPLINHRINEFTS